jgi:2-oxoglutarate dehydrogenase E2 component (dihydrolipoamide succinyltransferase)
MSVEIVVPELGESILEATINQWYKKEGDRVEVGEVLVELETDKVNLEVGAEQSGKIIRIDRQVGEDVNVGDVLGVIGDVAEGSDGSQQVDQDKGKASGRLSADGQTKIPVIESNEPSRSEETVPQTELIRGSAQEASATPVAQRLAHEQGVDLAQVQPGKPGGRITKGDVEGFLEKERTAAKATPPPQERPIVPRVGGPITLTERREERVKMSRRRRTIAQRLVEVQQTAALLTTFNEMDMSAVMDLRKRRNENFQKRYGVKIGITSFFVKAAVGVLKAFPRLNAEVQGDEMLLKYYYDIGVAVGDQEGLVVPVLRDADRKSFPEIETEIKEFANKAEQGSLTIEDLRGGTFSITNGGVFGSLLSTPILNPPQVGILGLHKIEQRPIVVGGEITIRPMMYVALSYDHRIVDGREAVQFLVRIKELIEDPEALLLEG